MKQCMGCMEIYQDNASVCPYCGYVEGTQTENTLHIEPGAILNNRYIIGKVLGYGGFGVTYIAWDSLLEQKVAIKEFLPSEFATRMLGRMEITIFSGDKEKQFLEGLVKFVEEAKKLAKFNNVPGIIKIFDCIEENNTAYIIMELLEGETLAERLEKEKKMSADKAISMLLPVMESLRQVNAQGIIHRDIAPDNIYITKQNEIKLIDFGAARYATTSLSRSLTIIIKPGYSPEEQYRSLGDQGSWTDVYSIGATLYRMITGEVPCDSMERRAYLEQNGEDMLKPISKFNNKIKKSQENAILNAMNIKVHERTPDMNRLIEELTSVTDIQRIETKKSKVPLFELPLWAKISSLAAVAVIVIIALLASRSSKATLMEKGMTRVPNIVNISVDEAISELQSSKLSYQIVGCTYTATGVDKNVVIYQSQSAGSKVSENTQIDIKVKKTSDTYEVTNVVGMSMEQAKKNLEAEGYTVETDDGKFSSSIAKDCVIQQVSDMTEGNKKAVLTLSKGPQTAFKYEQIEVPDYSNQQFFDVVSKAAQDGVTVQVMERKASSEHAEGTILSTSIGTYTELPSRVRRGTIMKLVVSSGNDEVTVADYTGQNIDSVRDILVPRGIVVEEVCELKTGCEHGEVYGQDVKKGGKLKTGDKITLNVAIGSEQFKVINVVDKSEEEATRLLKRFGLVVSVKKAYKKGVKDGFVISQSIKADNDAKVGDSIEIVVCDSSSDYMLPKMVGEEYSKIEALLKENGIECSAEPKFDETIKKGVIISASAEEGAACTPGSEVKFVVSAGPGDIASVANVVNSTETEAKAILEGQRLVVEVKYEFSNNVVEGNVISQSISAGERASSGDTITLTISNGKEGTLELSEVGEFLVGDSTQIIATYSPLDKRIEWRVDNEEIVRIEPDSSPTPKTDTATWNAKIVALKAGTATVTATITYKDGTKLERTRKVTVK